MPAAWKGELGDRELIAFDWCHERWWIGDHPSFLILHSLCKTGLNLDSNGLSAVLCLHRIEPLWDHCEPRVILPRKCNVTPRGSVAMTTCSAAEHIWIPGHAQRGARAQSVKSQAGGRWPLNGQIGSECLSTEDKTKMAKSKVKQQQTSPFPPFVESTHTQF